MSDVVKYRLQTERGIEDTEGFQFGRLAIREIEGELHQLPPHIDITGYWSVDHINTGFRVGLAQTFDEAVKIADDINVYAVKDLSTKNRSKLAEQMGPDLVAWLGAMYAKGVQYEPFRSWLQRRGSRLPLWMRRHNA